MNDGKVEQIGVRLKNERLRLDLSQLTFAEQCGVSRSTLAAWEKGEQTPSAAVLSVMAGIGVDVLYVVTGSQSSEPVDHATQQYSVESFKTSVVRSMDLFSAQGVSRLKQARALAQLTEVALDIAEEEVDNTRA